jgi:hypothetical protein
MATIAHGGMNPRAEKPKMPKKEFESMKLMTAENGGHIAEHHFTSFEHAPEQHVFAEPEGKQPVVEGSLLHHVAKHMGIPHSVVEAKAETADKSNASAHAPDEEEELEEEV